MAVAFYPQIKINSVYLTSNGSNGGTKYIATVRGLNAMAIATGVQAIKALSGKPYLQLSDNQLGKPVSLEFPSMLKADYQSVLDEIQDALEAASTITLELKDGDYGDFTLTVLPDENPVRFPGEFENGRLKNAAFHFLVAA